jgi:hypothetical protein
MTDTYHSVEQIMTLAQIRRFICENIHGREYIPQDNIQLPSPDGDYVDCDAVVVVNNQYQKKAIEKLFQGIDVKIGIVCL